MALDDATSAVDDTPSDLDHSPDPFGEGRIPKSLPHKVARSGPGNDVLNTIDVFGERSFSV